PPATRRAVTAIGPQRWRRPRARRSSKVRRSRMRQTGMPGRSRLSGRQPLAALQPPSPDDGPAGPVGHAVAEPVALRALAVVGLVGAHHCLLLRGELDRAATSPGGPFPGEWRADRAQAEPRRAKG